MMTRSTKEIHEQMTSEMLASHPDLSKSATAEWRLLTWVVATAIHMFELILTMFRSEIDAAADKITPGTARWYVSQCKRWQYGHEIKFNDKTAELYYEHDDPKARLIEVVAVSELPKTLSIKVAKLDANGAIIPITPDELYNFTDYIDSIKFAGIETKTVSTTADSIKYDVTALYDPAIPVSAIRTAVEIALTKYRSSLSFDSMFYKQRLAEAISGVRGVVTVELVSIERKSSKQPAYEPCAVSEELDSGYFNYDKDCTLTLKSIRWQRHTKIT